LFLNETDSFRASGMAAFIYRKPIGAASLSLTFIIPKSPFVRLFYTETLLFFFFSSIKKQNIENVLSFCPISAET
jgi:hypothetical protein